MHAWCCETPETRGAPKIPRHPQSDPKKKAPKKKKRPPCPGLQTPPQSARSNCNTLTPTPQPQATQTKNPSTPPPQEAHTHAHTLSHTQHTPSPQIQDFCIVDFLNYPLSCQFLWPNLRLPRKPTPMPFNAPHQCLIPMFLVSKGLHSDFWDSTVEAATPDMPLGMAKSIVCKKHSF